ncbi:hypothetical protein [Lactiplantibacillus xiangfangensis]|uniref:Uncharacterized protein n=1 Tax=Lactiplantibacillus xiangfangensis TaxID=942150 RepID=A0A0R2M1Y7_9LACO|nr:hypothetical protein [Lactiplantibacillus xiangfangensis]KRO08088.1 hypothetical protein IV64_GL000939 [Lactiplantibacillus xiangfangensis]
MLALNIQPGIITSQTITVNEELSYRVTLVANRHQRHFTLKVTALTLLGATVIEVTHFTDLSQARHQFTSTVTHLAKP